MFLGAFRAVMDDGATIITPTPWELAPDGRVHCEPEADAPREKARYDYIHGFYAHVAPGIPTAPNQYPESEKSKGRGTHKPYITSMQF